MKSLYDPNGEISFAGVGKAVLLLSDERQAGILEELFHPSFAVDSLANVLFLILDLLLVHEVVENHESRLNLVKSFSFS